MAQKSELRALITLAGKVDPSLQTALLKATGETMKLSNNIKDSSAAMSKFGSVVKKVFAGALLAKGVSRLASGISSAARNAIQLASDLEEVQNVVDVTFSENTKIINEWSKTALEAFGLTELQAKQFSGTIGAMLKSSGLAGDNLIKMSQNLTALAGDFASFFNLDPEEAFNKIRSGISGETEPLKQLGINMSVANLEAYALSKGIKVAYNSMDQASQMMLRYSYLMEVSKDVQGDFSRTQDSFANQTRLLKTNFNQLAASLAANLMPILTELLQLANKFIKNIDMAELQEKARKLINTVVKGVKDVLAAAVNIYNFIRNNWSIIEPMIWGIVGAIAAWKAITIGMKIYSGVMAAIKAGTVAAAIAQWGLNAAVLANPMTWIVLGIAAAVGLLIAGIVALYKNWDKVSTFFVESWGKISEAFKNAWSGISEWFTGLWETIKGIFRSVLNFFIDKINKLLGGVNKVSGIIGKVTGVNLQIPMIPTFASGGIATRPSIFGEAGPEMAIPLKRTPRSIGLLNQTAQILGVGGPNITINLTINAPGGDAQTIGDVAEDAVLKAIERYFENKERVAYGY